MNRALWGATAVAGIVLIAAIDYSSGVEVRTFPLYYAPIAVAAWQFGVTGAVSSALLSAAGWYASNQLAGLEFSHPVIWAANVAVQTVSFAVVGLLVARLHGALERERAISRMDPLCELVNGRAFYEEGARLLELCRRARRPITLAYLDLDNFKLVNDRRGHAEGDRLLRTFSACLRSTVRASDMAARVGGDEFVVLLPELGGSEAEHAVQRLHSVLSRCLAAESSEVTLTIGAASFLRVPEDVESLLQAADAVMYEAKRAGKARVRVLTADRSWAENAPRVS